MILQITENKITTISQITEEISFVERNISDYTEEEQTEIKEFYSKYAK